MRHNLALVAAVLALAVCVSGQVPQASKPFLDTQIAMNVRAPSYFLLSSCRASSLSVACRVARRGVLNARYGIC